MEMGRVNIVYETDSLRLFLSLTIPDRNMHKKSRDLFASAFVIDD
jgi:hypothetical protein